MRSRRPAAAALIVLAGACALAAGGCGGIIAPDLFIVHRNGTVPGAQLTLVVNEEGKVRCDGHASGSLSDAQLIEARAIQEELHDAASKHLALPAASGSVLSYRLRDADGSVSFADNSAGQPAVLRHLAYLVSRVSRQICRRPI
jgi:hypothetical protein